ncbi:hypothetical protein ID144_04250 [Pseudomonas sp. JM0905a]|uniref:DNA recombination protein RmuC n=1 Tax=Metapseudomonas resinovorans TaxID=53412 RepID=A0ABT4Y238_METRE|nr:MULTISPECIES: hypothetical protein [Pseudomonas]MBD2836251.1 hypothetical protein [Pseudomonas sp. JM0905a]MDA8482899.1 hypothetical protein [Pseudomonas resinovorans]
MSAMELTWALLGGAILLIALLMLALFWQELRVRYWQEALADMGRRLQELQAANDALRRENRRLRGTGQYLARPAGEANQALR